MNKTPVSDGFTRIHFLDVLAGIAILRVVYFHALSNYIVVGKSGSLAFETYPIWVRICQVLLQFSVPLFVLISGFKYSISRTRHGDLNYQKYALKRIFRLGLPFLIWTVFYLVTSKILHPGSWIVTAETPIGYIKALPALLLGYQHPAYQFWFIPMLLLVNLIYPLRERIRIPYSLTLTFFFIIYLLSRFQSWPAPFSYLEYFLFYETGIWLQRQMTVNPRLISSKLSLIIGISTGVLFILKLGTSHTPTVYKLDTFIIPMVTLSLFFIIAHLFRTASPGILTKIGIMAWPIYILHEPIVLYNISLRIYSYPGGLAPPIFLITGSLALITAIIGYKIIDKIPIINRSL